VIAAARRFESEILRAELAGEGSHVDTKGHWLFASSCCSCFGWRLTGQRRLVNIELRYNIAPTDFCRVKSQGVTGSTPVVSTIQSYRTTNPRADSEQAVSWGIFAGIVGPVRSPVTPAVSQADLTLPSLHPKNSVPRGARSTTKTVRQLGNIGSLGRPKAPFRARSVIIADSIRVPRTAGSILREHRAIVRRRYRVANGLRPRRARDLVRGTRARSSC
jgi:hypothetical protein